jgi:hypothetical protein
MFTKSCAHLLLGTLLLGRMVAHDFDLNTRTWYFVANGVAACACLAEVRWCSMSLLALRTEKACDQLCETD